VPTPAVKTRGPVLKQVVDGAQLHQQSPLFRSHLLVVDERFRAAPVRLSHHRQICCYPLVAGFSFFARVRVAFGFSARRSRRSGCLAASAAFAASALVGRPLARAAFVEEAGAGALRFAIRPSSRLLMHWPPQVYQWAIGPTEYADLVG
jgi:hypothetical protein